MVEIELKRVRYGMMGKTSEMEHAFKLDIDHLVVIQEIDGKWCDQCKRAWPQYLDEGPNLDPATIRPFRLGELPRHDVTNCPTCGGPLRDIWTPMVMLKEREGKPHLKCCLDMIDELEGADYIPDEPERCECGRVWKAVISNVDWTEEEDDYKCPKCGHCHDPEGDECAHRCPKCNGESIGTQYLGEPLYLCNNCGTTWAMKKGSSSSVTIEALKLRAAQARIDEGIDVRFTCALCGKPNHEGECGERKCYRCGEIIPPGREHVENCAGDKVCLYTTLLGHAQCKHAHPELMDCYKCEYYILRDK